MSNVPSAQRFWELDFVRGLAVILMVGLHYYYVVMIWSWPTWGVITVPIWWSIPAKVTAFAFIFVAGVAAAISFERSILKRELVSEQFFRVLQKSLILGVCSLMITVVTTYFTQAPVVFGILHFFTVSLVLIFLLRLYISSALVIAMIGAFLSLSGLLLYQLVWPFAGLVWLGFIPEGFQTLDYFPLLPYLGYVTLGLAAGCRWYKNNRRQFEVPASPPSLLLNAVMWMGQHSLLIYLLHVPLLIAVLELSRFFRP